MSHEDSEDTDLPSSKLGTKEYWDDAYSQELTNFNDFGDVGEVWFGEEAVDRMVTWLDESGIPKDSRILDLGCGNGVLLVELAKLGFTNLTGVDYSQAGVDLAKSVATKDDVDIHYEQADLLQDISQTSTPALQQTYDVCTDKGTYDAVCLNPENAQENRAAYIKSVLHLLKKDGYFVLTSCNWTEKELRGQYTEGFAVFHVVPVPKFTFGGKQGQSTTMIIFKKL